MKDEFTESLSSLKENGFFCGNENDTVAALYQRKNVTVLASLIKGAEGDTLYSLFFQQKELPLPETIQIAEDLQQFYSHEYLVSVFGEKHVIKDLYYFSEKEFSKCSVLFPDDPVIVYRTGSIHVTANYHVGLLTKICFIFPNENCLPARLGEQYGTF